MFLYVYRQLDSLVVMKYAITVNPDGHFHVQPDGRVQRVNQDCSGTVSCPCRDAFGYLCPFQVRAGRWHWCAPKEITYHCPHFGQLIPSLRFVDKVTFSRHFDTSFWRSSRATRNAQHVYKPIPFPLQSAMTFTL